jgi:hypothetical protein
MSTDERLFTFFEKHPEALPANIRTYDNGDDQTHGFYKSVSGIGVENYALNDPVLGNRVPKIVQLGLTMALMQWLAKKVQGNWSLTVQAPAVSGNEWYVEFGEQPDDGVYADDPLSAMLDAAETMEDDG